MAWFALKPTEGKDGKGVRRSQSSQWAPADEELWAGIQDINDNAPECDSENQQYYWIWCNIKDTAGTLISGWPEAKVRTVAQNKAKGMAGAQLESDFPLQTFSFKPFLATKLLPLLYIPAVHELRLHVPRLARSREDARHHHYDAGHGPVPCQAPRPQQSPWLAPSQVLRQLQTPGRADP